MCDLHSKFEKDVTKTAVAIVDDRHFGQTESLKWLYICQMTVMHCIGQTIAKLQRQFDNDAVSLH